AETRGNETVALADLEELPPQRDGRVVRHVQLEAVLARVAGATDDRTVAVHLALDEAVEANGWQVDVRDATQDRLRRRTLEREQRRLVRPVRELDAEPVRELADPLPVLLAVGRVDDEHVPVFQAVEEAVV